MTNKKTGIAVLECFQEIPCNPCVSACRAGAITKETLTSLPAIDTARCIGCRLCVAACPGQAIFFISENDAAGTAEITFPYEYRPLPTEGSTVTAVDRLGREVCPAVVKKVDALKPYNLTALVTIEVPAAYRDEVRFMRRSDAK